MSENQTPLEPPLEPDFVDEFADPNEERPRTKSRVYRRRPSLFGPLLLIGLGVLLLFDQFGYLDLNFWTLLGRFWPVLLILAGVDLLLGRRSAISAILGVVIPLLLIGGLFWLVFSGRLTDLTVGRDDPRLIRESVEYPLEDLEEADVHLDLGSWRTIIRPLDDSDKLIDADIVTYGELDFQSSETGARADISMGTHSSRSSGFFSWNSGDDDWRISLSPQVILDLELDCGSGSGDYDLRDLDLRNLVLDGGSGSFDLFLPDGRAMEVEIDVGSGSMDLILPDRGTAELAIEGGTGSTHIVLPDSMAARVELDSGSGSFNPSTRFQLVSGERRDDGVWETQDYADAENRILIVIEQGSGSVRIDSP